MSILLFGFLEHVKQIITKSQSIIKQLNGLYNYVGRLVYGPIVSLKNIKLAEMGSSMVMLELAVCHCS